MGRPRLPDPVKHCETCGVLMTRKRYGPSQTLEDMSRFLSRRNCGQSCGNTRAVVTKGADHLRARKHLRPTCEECGAASDLHVHHKDRDHTNNVSSNLMTLCSSCHLKLHWREDRPQRLAAVRRGVRTRRQSTAGSKS